MSYNLMTRKQVQEKVQLTRSSIYRLMRQGRFPLPLKIGPSAVRWRSDELSAWLESRPRAEGEIIPEAIPNIQGATYASAGA